MSPYVICMWSTLRMPLGFLMIKMEDLPKKEMIVTCLWSVESQIPKVTKTLTWKGLLSLGWLPKSLNNIHLALKPLSLPPNGQLGDSKNTNVDAHPSSSTTSSRYEALEVEPNTISLDAGVNNTQIEIAKPPLPKTPKPSNTEPSYTGKFKTNYKKQNHSKPYSKPHTPSIPSFGKSQT